MTGNSSGAAGKHTTGGISQRETKRKRMEKHVEGYDSYGIMQAEEKYTVCTFAESWTTIDLVHCDRFAFFPYGEKVFHTISAVQSAHLSHCQAI
jgi:hypothetical protein